MVVIWECPFTVVSKDVPMTICPLRSPHLIKIAILFQKFIPRRLL